MVKHVNDFGNPKWLLMEVTVQRRPARVLVIKPQDTDQHCQGDGKPYPTRRLNGWMGLPEVKTKTKVEGRDQNATIGPLLAMSRPFLKVFHVHLSPKILGVSGGKHLSRSRHGLHARLNLRPVIQSSRLKESRERAGIAASMDMPKTKGATIHFLF